VCYCFGVKTVNTHPDPLFDFTWPVAPDYRWAEWLDARHKPIRASGFQAHPDTHRAFEMKPGKERGPILMPVEGRHREIRPMDRANATLFRQFAAIDTEKLDEILSFARTFGWLGVTPRPCQVLSLPDGSTHHAEGEPLMLWVTEVAQMKWALYLTEHSDRSAEDEKYLGWLFSSHLQHVQGRMSFAGDTATLRIAPLTLLAAMWLQLALALAGNKTFSKCKHCGRGFEISTAQSGFRTNRLFCSESCKTLDYRKRHREALAQAKIGKSAMAIARATKTDRSTVSRWLAAGQQTRNEGRKPKGTA
jgi:hypothetical protein